MARAQRNQFQHDPQPQTRQEWDNLRDELEALLDQVNDKQRHLTSPEAITTASTASYGVDRPYADAEPLPELRRREALKSVQRAVQRFHEHEEAPQMPAQSPERLQSAIEQIRASQNRSYQRAQRLEQQTSSRRAPSQADAANSNQFADLRSAIAEIGGRMGRFEELIQNQSPSGRAVEEIAQQMEQLTGVVEMLAGSVGEQSHIKRIEGQIARLAESVQAGPDLDLDTMTERLEVLSGAFDRLSQLQAEQQYPEMPDYSGSFVSLESGLRQVSGEIRGLEMGGLSRDVEKMSGKLDSMDFSAVEACVRSVYDRIDALENNLAVPTPAIERLTRDLAEFTEVMRSGKGPVVSSTLVTRVDALNARLSEIEGADPSVDALKFDMEELRGAVVSAMEPRFSAIENQIGTLADQFGAPGPMEASHSIAGLEEQIRRLADRLDQTGEELTQLQSVYAENGQAPAMPDLSALADLVAERTQSALEQTQNRPGDGADAEAMRGLEDRLAQMLAEQRPEAPAPQDLSGLERSLNSVNQRLQSLEENLSRPDPAPAPFPASAAAPERSQSFGTRPQDEFAPDAHLQDAHLQDEYAPEGSVDEPQHDEFNLASSTRFKHPGLADAPAAEPVSAKPDRPFAGPSDSMPRMPTEEAALNAPAYPDPDPDYQEPEAVRVPVPSNLMSDPDDYAATGGAPDELDADEEFGDMSGSVRSTGDTVDVPRFDAEEMVPPPPPSSDFAAGNGPSFARDTARAEAARDADMNTNRDAAVPENDPSRSTFIAAARRAAQQGNQAGGDDSAVQSLFGRALSRFQKKRESGTSNADSAHIEPDQPPSPSSVEPVAAETGQKSRDQDEIKSDVTADEPLAGESFLNKYRRPILLSAAVVAVGLMTLNLVGQKLGSSSSAPETATANMLGTPVEPGAPTDPAAAPVEPAAPADSRPINGAEEAVPASDMPVGSIDQQATPNTPDVRMIDPTTYTEMPAPLELASFTPDQVTGAPDVLASPPEELGPEGLREAATGGDARAQFEVAAIYAEGRAVTQDLAASARWYERSAAQGFAPAAYRLGNLYENGTGVDVDLEKARFWYEKAAGMGNRMSMHNLASILAGGALGEQKFGEAAVWFERAAGLGLTDSQFNLGMLYARGLGVPQDLANSYKWFSIAAEAGDEDAAQARDDIARSLDAETVSQLQTELGSWAPQQLNIAVNFAPIGTWSDDFDPGPEIENRDIIKRVQVALNKLGFDTGNPDGLIGPKTHDAIRAFETATGMSESGDVNPRLLAVLGSQPV